MLTREELTTLQRSLEQRRVLSVYLDGRVADPAARHAWRPWLSANLARLRDSLAGNGSALREFDRCADHLAAMLAPVVGAPRSPGWVAFITSDGAALVEALPVPMPNAVHWTTAAWLSPYVRAQKELRPVMLVVVDARSARVYRYALGALTPIETFHAHARVDEPLHMGSAPRQHFHPGTRGSTGSDAAERGRREGTERMLREVIDHLVPLASPDAWILVGGMPATAREALTMLPDHVRARAALASGLSRITPQSALRRAAASGAMRLRRALDDDVVSDVIGRASGNGKGVVGERDARAALVVDAVYMLLLSLRFMDEHADASEEMTRQALAQNAAVEIVAGSAAARLDAVGGVAAMLRFPAPSMAPPLASLSPAGL